MGHRHGIDLCGHLRGEMAPLRAFCTREWRSEKGSDRSMTEGWQVAGNAARVYERELVPALFAEWPPQLLDAARVATGSRVLDVACGTGVVVRAALARRCTVMGVDLNLSMLEVAAELAPHANFIRGSASALPFRTGAFDAAVMQFALMYVPDRSLAVRELRRVVVPGGNVAAVVWAKIELNPGYRVLAALFDKLAGEHAATFRSPYSYGDSTALRDLFGSAGLTEIDVSTIEGTARFESVQALLRGEIDGSPLAGQLSSDDPSLIHQATIALGNLVQSDGRVIFPNPAVIVSGRA
jgi:ubiquinone/menaquinone biosynthesis C-methylase UbiE